MNTDVFDKAVDKLVEIEVEAVDRFIKDVVEPLEIHENPEKLISKPFEQWTAQDLQFLQSVYGTEEPNILSNFIFKKKYEQVQDLEEAEINA